MAAALCALQDLVTADPAPYRNLVPSFVNILKQARGRAASPGALARPAAA